MITKNDAAKFWAKYFNADEEEALACHHMTIDCMVMFAQEQVKNCSTPNVSGNAIVNIEKQVEILKKTIDRLMITFEDENDRMDYILDIVNEYKRQMLTHYG